MVLWSMLDWPCCTTPSTGRRSPGLTITTSPGWICSMRAGVNTGSLFGVYAYGGQMGPELFRTPLVMGISWLIMVYMGAAVAQRFTMHPFYRPILAGVLLTVFDFLLEPVAMWLNMWQWQGGNVPLMNYVMWFIVSVALASLYPILKIRIRNQVAPVLFLAFMIFFLILNGLALIEKWIA
ncbi:MAG: carotenoid biosynthesis protein, partial [Bacteroidales bacterium]